MSELGHRAADALTNGRPDAKYMAERRAARRAVYGDVVRPRDGGSPELLPPDPPPEAPPDAPPDPPPDAPPDAPSARGPVPPTLATPAAQPGGPSAPPAARPTQTGPAQTGPTQTRPTQTRPAQTRNPAGGAPPRQSLPGAPPRQRPAPSWSNPAISLPPPPAAESVPLPDVPALLCDPANRVLRVNAAFLRLAGRPDDPGASAGIVGRRVPQLVAADEVDIRLDRPDGTAVRARPLRWDVPGSALRIVVLVDITDLAGDPDEQTAGRGRLDTVLGLARVGEWSYDLATGTLHRGESLTELYRSLDLPAGTSPELAQIGTVCDELRTGAPAGTHHLEHRTPPPTQRVLSCTAQVERGADGAPRQLIGTVRDVTELRVAQERVRLAGQRFADLAATAPVAVAVLDPAGRLVDGNERLCALLGQPLAALRGRTAADLTGSPGAAEWLRPVEPGAAHGYQVGPVQLRRPDGGSSWCELSASVTVGDDGGRFWLLVFSEPAGGRATSGTLPGAAVTLDELTGLPNRAAATELVSHLLTGSGGARVAVLCAGVDHLRRVNDSLGHDAGDELLRKLAELLRSELPTGCTAARLAADEFVIICSDIVELGGLAALATRVRGVLRTTVSVRGQQVALSACVGAAGPPSQSGTTAADLLRFADAAMDQAKRLGPGRIALADEATVTGASEQLHVEAELRRAISTDQLVLHYQPVVGADGTVRTAEALVRWMHPTRGLIGPDDFLPAAGRGDLLRELDGWVLRRAIREAAGWPEHRGYPVSVAVNLAGLLPAEPDFLPTITEAVTEAGLPWSRLVLELVETSLVELPARTLAVMDELVARGVRFAVDDFGTGYSSLGRLKCLPVQIVKVDRAFVAGVSRDPADFALARAVVEVARAMGRRCVAEGVETPEQFHVLRGIGVDSFQGYLFARPVEAAALRELICGDRLGTPPG